MRQIIAGSTTTLLDADIGREWAAGDSFGASFIEEAGGTRIRLYVKSASGYWIEVDNVLDTNASRPKTAGYAGVALYNPSSGFTMDDLRLANLTVTPPASGTFIPARRRGS